MDVTVKKGKITWQTKAPKEMGCEFMTRGGCSATTQDECKNCRFVQPVTGLKGKILGDKAIEFEDHIREQRAEIESLHERIAHEIEIQDKLTAKYEKKLMEIEIMETTHYSEN